MTQLQGVVVAVAASAAGSPDKTRRERVSLVRGLGIAEDADAGNTHRQVRVELDSGDVETPQAHLRASGLDLLALREGRRLCVGPRAILQVTERDPRAGPGGGFHARVVRSGEVAPGARIATDDAFDRPRYAVLTLSDRRASGGGPDESGTLAVAMLASALGAPPLAVDLLPDDAPRLSRRLVELADDDVCDLIVTTGGTGLAPRDVTPEATLAVIDREVPGIAEAIRAGGLQVTPFAMLSRGVSGQRGSTLIVNLSGSPKAVREQLAILLPVLPHVLSTASGVPQTCAAPSISA